MRSTFIKPLPSSDSIGYQPHSRADLDLSTTQPSPLQSFEIKSQAVFQARFISALPVEFPLELFHPARGVDKSFFSGIGWVRIAGNIPNHNKVLLPINFFFPVRPHGRTSEELFACRNVDKTDGIHAWLDRLFLLCHYIRGSKVAV